MANYTHIVEGDIIMRNLILLALMGASFLFTGCGALHNVATTLHNNICVESYNKFVCADRSPTVSEMPAPRTRLCYGVSVRTKHGVNKIGHTNQGAQCKELQNETLRKAFQSKPGTTCAIEGKGENQVVVCAGFDHPVGILLILLTLLWGRGLRDLMVANVEDEGSYHNRYLGKDYICPFGRMWAACKVMIIAIIAIVMLLASTTNLYAACTDVEVAGNKVAAQYGMVLYDCDRDKVSQASKDAVYNVIYRGYVAQKGRLSKEYIRGRWARVESAFWSVWKDAPLWQAQIAAAICSKEFLCGVQVKYSEWESWRWVGNRTNNNGTQDCGITQINSENTAFSCDELQDFVTAFQEQRRIIMLKVRNSSSKAVWKKRIHRYNHKTNYEYGVKIWDWSGASFGGVILTFIIGLFRRRRKGQGAVGPIANGYYYPEASLLAWHQATPDEEPQDLQKRSYPIFTMDGWATAKIQKKLEGSLAANIEVNFILISDLTVVPQCVRIEEQPPMFPVLHIEDEFIFVAEGHKDDVLNPYIVEDKEFSLTQHQWSGETLHFRKTYWSNGNISSKEIEPSFPSWMNDDWEEGPQS